VEGKVEPDDMAEYVAEGEIEGEGVEGFDSRMTRGAGLALDCMAAASAGLLLRAGDASSAWRVALSKDDGKPRRRGSCAGCS